MKLVITMIGRERVLVTEGLDLEVALYPNPPTLWLCNDLKDHS